MRELAYSVTLADCEVQTFRAGGKGGQNQNKRDTGVRIIHHPSGARAESRQYRTQLQNKKAAFRKMAESEEFKSWVFRNNVESAKVVAQVEQMMWGHNIRVEYRKDGQWVTPS
jgi:protein subunit release factor B